LPQYARLEVQIAGAPVDKPVQLALNGASVGEVSVEVPELSDPGYQNNDGAAPAYIGWRKGVIYLPQGQLRLGDNGFQFSIKGVSPSSTANPLAIKNLLLQLAYGQQTSGFPLTPTAQTTPAPAGLSLQDAALFPSTPPPSATSFYRFTVGLEDAALSSAPGTPVISGTK